MIFLCIFNILDLIQVVEVGKKFFSQTLSTAFGEPRLKLIFDDAARYLREEGALEGYDVIICDSSDPVGPAETLFQPEFFQSMYNALAPNGKKSLRVLQVEIT